MEVKRFEAKIGKETLIIENGKLAKQADGSVCVRYGETVVLITAVMSSEQRPGLNFLPLTVEFQERTYAAGKIPGGFFKREGRPSEKEILSARMIDRPIRPLFPKGLRNDLQIVATVLSSDIINDGDILAIIGTSTALGISNIPFDGPLAAVRVARVKDEFIIFPSYAEVEESSLSITITSGTNGIVMLEAGAQQVSKELVEEAIQFGLPYLTDIIKLQEKIISEIGVEKVSPSLSKPDDELIEKTRTMAQVRLNSLSGLKTKEERAECMALLKDEVLNELVNEENGITKTCVKECLDEVKTDFARKFIVEKNARLDGRAFEEVREITCEAGLLPRTHGSGLFTRGQTQSLAVVTLGTASDEQRIDALAGETKKSFMLHYNFPPFSVGEARPMRGPGRREIGHGALAEKALKPVMPSNDDFPYTVRLVSDILESNGSSSMASVCGGSLALMDAGVPIEGAVAGIALGLIKENGKSVILTDIAGMEDHCGDMDFKAAGTEKGITAIQMDVKINGLSLEMISKVLAQSEKARLSILDKMKAEISETRADLSEFAPRITTLQIPTTKIGEVIGPSGKTIRKIIADTGVSIDINDEGRVMIASTDAANSKKAISIVEGLIAEAEVGKLYKGKIVRVENFGAFVEFLPGKSGLVHVSALSNEFVKSVGDVVKIGDEVIVKVTERDNLGRINLSIKAVTPDEKDNFKA
ncbi:MAG: polyribonucleotide nucleotidyltransferase [Candidatus Omnitrophica bacterium]|nr:polyribonucleotide nucleotidyltransferase [Candidatus Omnitrophota bacterium]